MGRRCSISRVLVGFCVLCAVLSGAPRAESSQDFTGNLNVFLGQRWLDSSDWEPIDTQYEAGIEVDIKSRNVMDSISFAFAVLYSYGKDDDKEEISDPDLGDMSVDAEIEANLLEIDIGLKKVFDDKILDWPIVPFVGVGFCLLRADASVKATITTDSEAVSEHDDDGATVLGGWGSAGLYVTVRDHFNIGLQGRYSITSDLKLFGTNFETSSWHFGALAGYHW